MAFCCGASMIGAMGSLQSANVLVHQVPLLYCPVCKSMKIHPKIKDEYELLIEFAEGDRASEVVFTDFIDLDQIDDLHELCISWDNGHHERLLREQIDNALDLLTIAKNVNDAKWEQQLKERLKYLSHRLFEWKKNQSNPLRG